MSSPATPSDSPGTATAPAEATTPQTAPSAMASANRAMPMLPGYTLGELIGSGGMGVVYRAVDQKFDRDVALKFLREEYPHDGIVAARFLEEARITAQLQHPGIPAVHDLGTLFDGRPYLAMKLIKGQSLDEMIKSKQPLDVLAIFEPICRAIGYAHAHGVLHRDLKPANIMVGAFGEVQVMDWGLAKLLASPDRELQHDSAEITTIKLARDDHTSAGSVMGTPAYMAPEQAIGAVDDLSPPSDVFSLGGILCALLTGQPPFVGANAESTRQLAATARLDETFSRLDSTQADPELLAFCRKCLSPQQADRFADGNAAAEAVAKLRSDAEERARTAEVQRGQSDVRRRLQLRLGGAIAAAVLIGAALAGWQAWRATREAAKTRMALDTVSIEQAKTAKALADLTIEEGKTKAALAQVTAEQDRLKLEKKNTIAALNAMTDDVVEKMFSRQTHLSAAERGFLRNVIALYEKATAEQSQTANSRDLRAEGHFRVAKLQQTLNEFPASEINYNIACDAFKSLVADFPDVASYRVALAISHNNLGVLYGELGRFTEQEAAYRAALDLRQNLVTDFPTVPEYKKYLALTHSNLGLLLVNRGRLSQGEAEYRTSREMQKDLVTKHPDVAEYRIDLAVTLNNIGLLLSQTGQVHDAEVEYRAASELRKCLVRDFPDVPEHRADLAYSQNNLGLLYMQTGRVTDAEVECRAACGLRRSLVAEFPAVADHRANYARSLFNLGFLLAQSGRAAEAEVEYRAAHELRKSMVSEFPKVPSYRSDLANSHNSLGTLLVETGRTSLGESEYRAALELRKTLIAEFPDSPTVRCDLALSHNNLGILMADSGRVPLAVTEYETARKLQEALVAEFPAVPEYANGLAGTLLNWAHLLNRQQKPAEALRLLREAEVHHRTTLAAEPRNPTFRRYYYFNRFYLTNSLSALGDHAALRVATRELLEFSTQAQGEYYYCSRLLASAIGMAAKDAKLSVKRRSELKNIYSDEAIQLLEQAVARGYHWHWHIQKDPALEPLRDHKDFAKLVADMAKKYPALEPAPPPRRVPDR